MTTQRAWPAWALTNNERCKTHDDPGCPICNEPLNDNDYRDGDPEILQDWYEKTIGWGPDQT
jgi:hypothetical protein